MTGAVTYEQIFALFGVLVVAGGAVAGAVGFLWRVVSLLKKRYDLDREELEGMVKASERELQDYKQHVAETYASKEGVSVQIGRLETAVNGIATKVEDSSHRITERIDRLLEARPSPRRSGG
jgi:hypothetical protein